MPIGASDADPAAAAGGAAGAPGGALRVAVVNGNLRFVRQPLVVGHYRSAALTGTERVVDELVGGALHVSLGLARYPDAPGTHQLFGNVAANRANPLQRPLPEAVIVVGLGDEGALGATDLSRTVRQGVIAWAQRVVEEAARGPGGPSEPLELAATLVGSGGVGVTTAQAAQRVVQGVLDANRRLAAAGCPTVARLSLVELYLDRAAEAWRALRPLPGGGAPYALDDAVHTAEGALLRPLNSSYRGAGYDLIRASTVPGAPGGEAIAYVLDTDRARTEVRAQATQGPLLRALVASASNEAGAAGIGRTLCRLLLPSDLEPFVRGTTDMVLEVDGGTAGIPWELLDTSGDDDDPGEAAREPWAIQARLLRKLRTADFRPRVVDANARASILVVGEPACDPRYPRLPGARAEARAVEACFRLARGAGPGAVRLLAGADAAQPGPDARAVVTALLERDWRVVHIAGHGAAPEPGAAGAPPGDPRGVVLSDGTFLGPREIRTMRTVPELVFVNCCHLAARDPNELLGGAAAAGGAAGAAAALRYDRAQFAASVAESLIGIGVRCVVAAGWAVADDVARRFATTFYERLLEGERFAEAVQAARKAARAMGGHTWAAYQCYGDPNWTLVRGEGEEAGQDAGRAPAGAADAAPAPAAPDPAGELVTVASVPGLVIALQTIATNSRYEADGRSAAPAQLADLERRFGERWGTFGAVADAFGAAWADHDPARALAWYRRALAAADGGASLRAAEQVGHLRARLAWASVGDRPGADALAAARGEIADAARFLEGLAALEPTVGREARCGAAWRRLALLEAAAGRAAEEADAIRRMRARYANAERLARAAGDPRLYEPALNRMAAELAAEAAEPGWPGFDPESTEAVRTCLERTAREDPNFRGAAGRVDLAMFEAVARGALAGAAAAVEDGYAELYRRAAAARLWQPVLDQARFVTARYAARAGAAERTACAALEGRLAAYAGAGSAGGR